MLSRITFYSCIYPLSLLPLSFLYIVAHALRIVLFNLFKYRKGIIYQNLENSFPEKNTKELNCIAESFYRHFSDLIVESIKAFTISEEELSRRMRIINPELLDDFYKKKQSLILVTGHYGNWEWAAITLNRHSRHRAMGIYRPLKNNFFNEALRRTRERLGTALVSEKRVPYFFEQKKEELYTYSFIGDQTPSNPRAAHWATFLNQPTPIFMGADKYARKYNYPVLYGHINKVKRGFYEIEYFVISENPAAEKPFAITEKHTEMLEQKIKEKPEHWLWSHRRWKHKKPA